MKFTYYSRPYPLGGSGTKTSHYTTGIKRKREGIFKVSGIFSDTLHKNPKTNLNVTSLIHFVKCCYEPVINRRLFVVDNNDR